MELKEGDKVQYIGANKLPVFSQYLIDKIYTVIKHPNYATAYNSGIFNYATSNYATSGLGIYNGINHDPSQTFRLPDSSVDHFFEKVNNIEIKQESDYYKWLANRT